MIEAKYLKIKQEQPTEAPAPNQFDAVLEFQRYWNEREDTLKPAVLQAFEELHQEITGVQDLSWQ